MNVYVHSQFFQIIPAEWALEVENCHVLHINNTFRDIIY